MEREKEFRLPSPSRLSHDELVKFVKQIQEILYYDEEYSAMNINRKDLQLETEWMIRRVHKLMEKNKLTPEMKTLLPEEKTK